MFLVKKDKFCWFFTATLKDLLAKFFGLIFLFGISSHFSEHISINTLFRAMFMCNLQSYKRLSKLSYWGGQTLGDYGVSIGLSLGF